MSENSIVKEVLRKEQRSINIFMMVAVIFCVFLAIGLSLSNLAYVGYILTALVAILMYVMLFGMRVIYSLKLLSKSDFSVIRSADDISRIIRMPKLTALEYWCTFSCSKKNSWYINYSNAILLSAVLLSATLFTAFLSLGFKINIEKALPLSLVSLSLPFLISMYNVYFSGLIDVFNKRGIHIIKDNTNLRYRKNKDKIFFKDFIFTVVFVLFLSSIWVLDALMDLSFEVYFILLVACNVFFISAFIGQRLYVKKRY